MQALVVRDSQVLVPPLPPVYVLPRKELKRPKKGVKDNDTEMMADPRGSSSETGATNCNDALSAGSFEERRRAQ